MKLEKSEKRERVRFIGVDTPESVGKYKKNPEYFGKEASEFTNGEGLKLFFKFFYFLSLSVAT